MSDGRLRDAERRWRESGHLDDRVRWWSELARAGELPEGALAVVEAVAAGRLDLDRVQLAAYLGEPRAQALVLEDVVERVAFANEDGALRVVLGDPFTAADVVAWVSALRRWDPRAAKRAVLSVTRQLARQVAALDLAPPTDVEDPYRLMELQYFQERGLRYASEELPALAALLDGDASQLVAVETAARRQGVGIPLADAVAFGAAIALDRDTDEAFRRWRLVVAEAEPEPEALRAAVQDEVATWALRGSASSTNDA